ncbi:uncharacterized protein LOC142175354 [Nicotiana tabacum]|uniref:Uncharacterized protein LOC142175354 n=1 Tax=Nicotiana tabacum TaxID=4097 RepID=A0AC58TLD6_TOBAC
MTEIPLWVKFPKLPISSWGCGSLERIASALGKPLFANECTTKQTRISYARMLIHEVNVSKLLPDKITIMEPNRQKFQQEVECEWKPQFCPQCLTIGHVCSLKKPEQHLMERQIHNKRRGEQKKVVQEWKPKEVPSTSQTVDKQQLDHLEVAQLRVAINEGKYHQQEVDSQIQEITPDGTVRNASKGKEQMPIPELNLINFPQLSAPMASKSKPGKIMTLQREDQRTRQAKSPDLGVRDFSSNFQCVLTVVYGFNTVEERRSLWDTLQNISYNTNSPWLVYGDFNAILSTTDRISYHPVSFNEVKDFSDCITATLLSELQWKGEFFTWSNKQQGSDMVCSKIDKAFGNNDWMMMCGHIVLEYDLLNISDHAPILLTLNTINYSIRVPFRFFNIWSDHAQFLELIDTNWKKQLTRDPMQNVWNKLKALRPVFRQLNQKKIQATSLKIMKAREELHCIQAALVARYDDSLVTKEKKKL